MAKLSDGTLLESVLDQDGSNHTPLTLMAARTQKQGREGWGGFAESVAISHIFSVKVDIWEVVKDAVLGPGYMIRTTCGPPEQAEGTLSLLFINDSHYDELRPPSTVPPPSLMNEPGSNSMQQHLADKEVWTAHHFRCASPPMYTTPTV